MKHITCMAAALAGLSLATSASAQMWGSTGGVTVALTYSYTTEALAAKDEVGKVIPAKDGGGPTFSNNYSVDTVKRVKIDYGDGEYDYEDVTTKTVTTDEYGSKIATGKWGNADIIKALVQAEVLPQKGKSPYTAGWSLVAVNGMDGEPVFYARHADKTAVMLDDILSLSGEAEEIEARAKSEKTIVTDYSPIDGESYSTESHTLTESYKTTAMATVPFIAMEPGDLPMPLDVFGLLTGSGKVVLKSYGSGEEKVIDEVYVPGALKLDKITGTTELGDIIEGTISVAAGTVVDLTNYFPEF